MAGYQIKIMLHGTKPPVWRRVIIPAGITFSQMHRVILAAMGPLGNPPYFSIFGGGRDMMSRQEIVFADVSEKNGGRLLSEFPGNMLNAEDYRIDDYLELYGKFRFTCGDGDDWLQDIMMEKKLEDWKKNSPVLMKLKGRSPSGKGEGDSALMDKPETPFRQEKAEIARKDDNITISASCDENRVYEQKIRKAVSELHFRKRHK